MFLIIEKLLTFCVKRRMKRELKKFEKEQKKRCVLND